MSVIILKKRTILTGLSAGSICWFEYGHSDSFRDETGEYSEVKGLGILPGLHCPHYNERPEFDEFIVSRKINAIAIDDNCAVVFQDNNYKVIKSVDSANAYLFAPQKGIFTKSVIDNTTFMPIERLFNTV